MQWQRQWQLTLAISTTSLYLSQVYVVGSLWITCGQPLNKEAICCLWNRYPRKLEGHSSKRCPSVCCEKIWQPFHYWSLNPANHWLLRKIYYRTMLLIVQKAFFAAISLFFISVFIIIYKQKVFFLHMIFIGTHIDPFCGSEITGHEVLQKWSQWIAWIALNTLLSFFEMVLRVLLLGDKLLRKIESFVGS